MRILSLDVQQFGALHGRRFNTDADVVVVFGRNERGKSSFHQALRSALFGFAPASAKLHPYANGAFHRNRESDEASLEVGATLSSPSGSGAFTIERRMDAAPSSRLTLANAAAKDTAFARSNAAVQGIHGITAHLFDAVYTLDPDSTRAFDRHLDTEVEELLLGGGAIPGLPSLTELMTEIDADRARLWRDDRRSKKTVVALLDARLAELQSEGRETRRIEEGLLRLELELERGREELVRDEKTLRRLAFGIAALHLIQRAARIASAALEHDVDLDPFDHVELTAPGPMLAELEDAEILLETPTRRLSQPTAVFSESDRRLIDHRETVLGLPRDEARASQLAAQVDVLLQQAGEKRAAAVDIERSLRRQPPETEALAPLADDDLAALRAGAAEWKARWAADHAVPLAVHEQPPRGTGLTWAVATGAGALAAGATFATGAHWGGAVAAAVGPLAVAGFKAHSASPASVGENGRTTPPSKALLALVRRLQIDPALASGPGEVLAIVEPLSRALSLRAEADRVGQQAESVADAVRLEHSRWQDMALDLGPDIEPTTWTSPNDAVALLGTRLRAAEEHSRAHAFDQEERQRAADDQARASDKLRDIETRFEVLRAALERSVPDEPMLERAHERASDAWTARERSRGALRELRADPAWAAAEPDQRLKTAIEKGEFDTSELDAIEGRANDLEEHLAGRREEWARADERLTRERPTRTRSAIDSEIASLREERGRALARHGELTGLRDALAEGERRHRDAHQPAILRSASRWLEAITDGRYRDLAYGGAAGAGLTVLSREAEAHVPCEAPLSRGVREQIHLALRLGVAEAMDAGADPLPMLLDEALVHWDDARRAGLYRALAARGALPGARQLFLFTCHEVFAAEAESDLGALRIDL